MGINLKVLLDHPTQVRMCQNMFNLLQNEMVLQYMVNIVFLAIVIYSASLNETLISGVVVLLYLCQQNINIAIGVNKMRTQSLLVCYWTPTVSVCHLLVTALPRM